MSYYREKGSFYDVPSDDMDLSCDEGYEQPAYDPNRYMDKQREFARKTKSQLEKEEYKYSRYK